MGVIRGLRAMEGQKDVRRSVKALVTRSIALYGVSVSSAFVAVSDVARSGDQMYHSQFVSDLGQASSY
jgi:hypothetical protein